VSDSNGRLRRIDIEWGPAIDAAAYTGCSTCIDFCHHDVYQWTNDESQVVVAHKLHCVPGCSHCATLCEAKAISFPTFEEIKRARREVKSRCVV
jgi:NAD-dependent dihydropyrimidine dehydrogenase PreA subunit